VDALKKELEENIEERQAARNNNQRYYFTGVRANDVATNLLYMVANGRFLDKSEIFRKCIDVGLNDQLGVIFTIFARRFGKTTFLSFLKNTLGLLSKPWEWRSFYNALSGLRQGDFFLNAPIRPVILLSVAHTGSLPEEMGRLFEAHGIYRRRHSKATFKKYLLDAIDLLQQLFEEAKSQLSEEHRGYVRSQPLILIDEFDAAYRLAEEDPSTAKGWRSVQRSLKPLMASLKTRIEAGILWGVCITSLMPLGKTGLSELDCSHVLNFRQEFHEMFGVSEEELMYVLKHQSSGSMSLDRVLQWARNANIIGDIGGEPVDEEEQLRKWLSQQVNGFCMALYWDGGPLSPLYSPLDIIEILLSVQSTRGGIPARSWIDRSRDVYGDMLNKRINESDLRVALTGGVVDISYFNQRQVLKAYFKKDFGAHCSLLFYLGLLQVADVYRNQETQYPEQIVLMPPNNARSLDDVIHLMNYTFPAREPKLSESKIDEYTEDHELFKNALLGCVTRGCRRISASYRRYHSLREIPVQDAIYHCIEEELHHPTRLRTKVERYIKDGSKRIDIICVLNEFTLNEFTVIIEVKMERGPTIANRKAYEALEQAADYRRRLGKSPQACALLAVVMAWKHKVARSWYGEYTNGIPEREEDLGDPSATLVIDG
jgi:hypothetical protein